MSAPTSTSADAVEVDERPRDEGMTLVELLVAMGLAMLLMVVVLTFTVVAIRSSDASEARNDNINAGQVGMAAASKVIRTAVLPTQLDEVACSDCSGTAILQASKTQMSFYANLDNNGGGPSLITLKAIADPDLPGTTMLQQTLVPPTMLSDGSYTFCNSSSASCNHSTRVLVRGLPRTPTVFAYYDLEGDAVTNNPLTATDLIKVSSIDVMLTVQLRPGQTRTPATTLVQRVSLPNADANAHNSEGT